MTSYTYLTVESLMNCHGWLDLALSLTDMIWEFFIMDAVRLASCLTVLDKRVSLLNPFHVNNSCDGVHLGNQKKAFNSFHEL